MDTSPKEDPWRHPEDPPPRKLTLRGEPPPRLDSCPPPPSVHEILEDNLSQEAERPINGPVSEHRAHTKRLSSWILGLVLGNAFLFGVGWFLRNGVVMILIGAAMVSFTLAYSWHMLQVRSNY